LSRSIASRRATAGFSLIEVLVALAIIAMSMASIGGLMATTARGVGSVENHLTRLAAARELFAALPDRDRLVLSTSSGTLAEQRWRLDVTPFQQGVSTDWLPQAVVLTVQSSTGAQIQISTVRLQRRVGK
jgi:general secretion pathway protein I